MIDILIPLKLESVANLREHWRARAARTKSQRLQVWAELRAVDAGRKLLGDVAVTLTRIAPRQLDGDNLQSACKAVRDGVADWLGVPDNHPAIEWRYGQSKGLPKQYGLRIQIEMKE